MVERRPTAATEGESYPGRRTRGDLLGRRHLALLVERVGLRHLGADGWHAVVVGHGIDLTLLVERVGLGHLGIRAGRRRAAHENDPWMRATISSASAVTESPCR